MTQPALQISGLSKTFGSGKQPVEAVRAIDLVVDPGEVVALLGPNGAGKTTTLDMVLGLTKPSAGTVAVFGKNPREAIAAGRVSAVLQTGGLLNDLSVRETLEYVASTYSNQAPVEEALTRAGIESLANRRVSKCSGGEQQRLRFAIALLPRPDLLILDEPTAGMDVTARREFWSTMHGEARAGRTVVFATHYLEEADSFADRIVMMSRGEIVADGSTEEIRASATGKVVSAEFADPVLAARRLADLGNLTQTGTRISVRGPDPDAIARAMLCDLDGHDLEVQAGSLDDAFVQLTQGADR